MPPPHHLRHPAPHPPHRHTTRVPTPTPQHTPPDRHAPPARRTRPLHTHPTTPYLLPSKLYLYICTSHPPPTARSHPALSSPLLPFRTAPHPPLPHALTPSSAPHSHPSILLPTPLPCTLRSLFCRKVCIPPPKASRTHLWKSFVPKEEEHLSSTPYPADIMWITP